ncbi:MAG: cupin domain-containing protein [Candidatus Micrarchaeota archaeon]|nr:cupin domain-containing protein [Candidatus Micrarchaeota archaeon]
MKLVRSSERRTKRNPGRCIVHEYDLEDADIDGAVAEIAGREPAEGFEANKKCKELCYVAKGRGRLVLEKESVSLRKGDMVLIQPMEKYYWDGNMTLVVSCSPKWRLDDHIFVE